MVDLALQMKLMGIRLPAHPYLPKDDHKHTLQVTMVQAAYTVAICVNIQYV